MLSSDWQKVSDISDQFVVTKNGRPKGTGSTWNSETTIIRVPKIYAEALREIALEWQSNKPFS